MTHGRITFLVERPTQFEAPFYRFAALHRGAGEPELRVLFHGRDLRAPVQDAELGRGVDWQLDLFSGYPQAFLDEHAPGFDAALAAELAQHPADLLILNGYTRAVYRRAARAARRRAIATALRLDSVRFPSDPPIPLWKRFLFGRVLTRAFDRFLGTGSLTLRFLAECRVPAERTGLFPYAVDHAWFAERAQGAAPLRQELREAWGAGESQRVVLAVAKHNDREAPWDLLRALPVLADERVLVVLAGDGPLRTELEAAASDLAPGRVRFLGYVPYIELPRLYAAADLFVHVPQEERWGVSVAEAMACGLPVVAGSRVGAAVDLVLEGANGAVTANGDPKALASGLRRALALERRAVASVNDEILGRWDYAATWRSLVAACRAVAAGGR